MKAYDEKFIMQPRKAASVVFPLHKSSLSEVIIHLDEENERPQERKICLETFVASQHLCSLLRETLVTYLSLFKHEGAHRDKYEVHLKDQK